ncbi:enoyl-CoA hydratase/isomerase family protein [Amycolatopsis thermoflava]|uniref:enoyl-CoA hydratase/isomerase family protein n=1 Tax=Amycolatopsis thermoflava TaxID=84480 RepID=UPI0037F2BD9C
MRVIVLDRPAQANALDMSMARQLRNAVAELDRDTGCVLIQAEGRAFCTGGDVAAFAAADQPGRFLAELAEVVHESVAALAAAEFPVIAAVHGWAAGAGMSLAAICDIVIAGTSARFRAAYPGVGLSPDGGLSWSLPRLVGRSRAAELLLTNRLVTAEEAARIGLVAQVVPDAELEGEALTLARHLADGPTTALGRTKRLLSDGHTSLNDQLAAEATSIALCADGPEGRAGVTAFVEGRAPVFHPRA